jgi:hypothetical protein
MGVHEVGAPIEDCAFLLPGTVAGIQSTGCAKLLFLELVSPDCHFVYLQTFNAASLLSTKLIGRKSACEIFAAFFLFRNIRQLRCPEFPR